MSPTSAPDTQNIKILDEIGDFKLISIEIDRNHIEYHWFELIKEENNNLG